MLTISQKFFTPLLPPPCGSKTGLMKHRRLSPCCGCSWPQASVGRQQPLWRWGWGRQVLFPRPEPSSQGVKVAVRKLAKVSQVPLALLNPLFHPQPLETPLISPSAASGGVALLLQDSIYFSRFQTMLLQSLKSVLFQLVSSNTQERCGSITLVCFSFPSLFLTFFFFLLFWQEILLLLLLHKYEVTLWKQVSLLVVYVCKNKRTVLLIKLYLKNIGLYKGFIYLYLYASQIKKSTTIKKFFYSTQN